MLDGAEVVRHSDVPEINMLLVGRNPDIFKARPNPQSARPAYAPVEPSPRFAIHEPEFESPKTARPDFNRNSLRQAKLLSQVKSDEEFTKSLETTLAAYENAHRVKAIVHERDYMSHYYRPLQMRIKEQMVGRNYRNYKQRQSEIIRKMDEHPIAIQSPEKPIQPPGIRVNQRGLRDPTNKFAERQQEEERLTRFINEANGITSGRRKLPPLATLDYKALEARHHTRFFFGTDESQVKSGRRFFPGRGVSKVGEVLDYFQ